MLIQYKKTASYLNVVVTGASEMAPSDLQFWVGIPYITSSLPERTVPRNLLLTNKIWQKGWNAAGKKDFEEHIRVTLN